MFAKAFTLENGLLSPGEAWNEYVNANRDPVSLERIGAFITGTAISNSDAFISVDKVYDRFVEATVPPFSDLEIALFTTADTAIANAAQLYAAEGVKV